MIREYLKHGFVLVPFARGHKGPEGPSSVGWNKRQKCISDPKDAGRITENVGLAHAYSRTASIDLDRLDAATAWFAEFGIMVGSLMDDPESVRISSGRPNRAKLLYKLPEGVEPLRTKQILDDTKAVILEFRCATATGTTTQCVLPPSIHPDTGQPYVWEYGDELIGDWRSLPVLPPAILSLWQGLVEPVAPSATKLANTVDFARVSELLKSVPCPDGYPEWYPFLMCVHNLTNGSADGLKLVIEWSKTGSNFAGARVIASKWNRFDGSRAEYGLEWLESKAPDKVSDPDEFEVVIEPTTSEKPQPPALPGFKRDKSGRIESTVGNVLMALRATASFNIQIQRDTFRDEIMLTRGAECRPFKDADYVRIREEFERRGFKSISREMMRDAVLEVADTNQFDSAQTWLQSLVWDGVPRIDRLLEDLFKAAPSLYTTAVSRYLMTALAGRVLNPGCKADMVPVLLGPQGCGKTRGVEALAPQPDLETKIDLNERDDNLARLMRGQLIGEIAELKGLQAREAGSIKAFLSRSHDSWVPKYVEFVTHYPRRIVFVGTTNEEEFLADETGNRRWLPIRVGTIDVAGIHETRDQLWAEAAMIWSIEGVAYHDAEYLAEQEHGQYVVSDSWEDAIEHWLNVKEGKKSRREKTFTVSELAIGALQMDIRTCGKSQEMRIGKILHKFGFHRTTLRINKLPKKVWTRLPLPPVTTSLPPGGNAL